MQAYTIFIDLSGFTPITEKLMSKGKQGAEELSNILNDIFAPPVNLVYAKGGFIPYFAGDSFTAIFPYEEGGIKVEEVLQTAVEIREDFVKRNLGFGAYKFGIKAGLSFGIIEWGIVGNANKAFYFRGDPMDGSANAQSLAGEQQIVIDESIKSQLEKDSYLLEPIRGDFFVVEEIPEPAPLEKKPGLKGELSKEIAALFLPDSVVNYRQQGEFRNLISVFISFEGLDRHQELDEFASLVLENFFGFSGYFKEIEFGDKGGVMAGFFGAPVSFENNVKRALEFIVALEEEMLQLQLAKKVRFRAGISLGTAYTGIVGGEERCQYAAVGNRVNLAARLMTYADWGEILVDEGIHVNRHFKFSHKGDIKYKGIPGSIPTFRLDGREQVVQETYSGRMIGREPELKTLMQFCESAIRTGKAGIASIFGEAGIGKSRLSHELRQRVISGNPSLSWFICQTDQILRKPFNPFIYFLKDYFRQAPDQSKEQNDQYFEDRFDALVGELAIMDPPNSKHIFRELHRTKSVLAALVGIEFPDSLWDQLDAKGRYRNSITAVANLIFAEALLEPLVLEIEDAHWIDDSSKELLQEIVKHQDRFGIILFLTSRFDDDGSKPVFIDEKLLTEEISSMVVDLGTLQPQAVKTLAETTLGEKLSKSFYELLLNSTNSNPFYLEQMLEFFVDNQLLLLQDGEWMIKDSKLKLPNSINAILTARIDRLPALAKEVVKAAAVIGREFEIPVLLEVVKRLEQFSNYNGETSSVFKRQVETAEKVQIWLALNELRYVFRHSLLREAAYDMQLRARQKRLHLLTALALEKLYADESEERYADLAFHFERAGNVDKTRVYLYKAGKYAEENYQNQQALEYYNKLLRFINPKKEAKEYIRILLRKGKILEVSGKWDECESITTSALKLALKSGDDFLEARLNNRLGYLLTLKGQYPEAKTYLQLSVDQFEHLEDSLGIAKVYGNLGNLNFRQGDYEAAKSYFERCIDLSPPGKKLSNRAQVIANLGLTYMNQGNYEEAIRYQRTQLKLTEEKKDKSSMAILLTNLGIVYFEKGDFEQALESFQSGLLLSEELGNMQLTSIAIGCIGSVYERKGDYVKAMDHFQRDLALCEELGDKQGLAIALGLIGEHHSIKGDFYQAIEYLQKNLMLCEELGYQKGIAKAVNTLGDVFLNLEQFERALDYYNRAIEVTRHINNKLVLGASLVEKAEVLFVLGRLDDLELVKEEALKIALEIKNPDLLFNARLLAVRAKIIKQKKEKSEKELLEFLERDLDEDQEATLFFELAKLFPQQQKYRLKALQLYQKLFNATPKYSYRKRLELLQSEL